MLVIWMGTQARADVADTRTFRFPSDAGVVDVTQPPYNATPDDATDDTSAIQQALDDHANGNRVIYLPDGVYVISDTLRWPDGHRGGMGQKRLILQGQSRDGTVLQLRSKTNGFTDPEHPKAMIWTGVKPAQRFRNGVWTLTLDTGRANPGAIGLQYIANNQGSVRHLLIRSGDAAGRGVIGLDLGYTDEQGPCLIKDVEIHGFDLGVRLSGVVNSVTFEGLTLRNQREVGIRNHGQVISIRHLDARGTGPALENLTLNSLATVLDSSISSTRSTASSGPAILNQGAMLVRDTTIEGYRQGIENTTEQGTRQGVAAGEIALFVSHQPYTVAGRVEADAAKTLRLEVKETPGLAQPPLDTWAGPHQFGGSPDDTDDDTEAVQKAIDSGARVLYFPQATRKDHGWKIDGTVLIRRNVERVTALEGRLRGKGTLRLLDGEPDTVSIDRMDLLYQGLSIENPSDRTLVFSGVTRGNGDFKITGKGDVFLEDVVGHAWYFHGNNVWARQLNVENDGLKTANRGGQFWCLGLKTEQAGTVFETTEGGSTEILGGFIYAQGKPKTTPMFVVDPDSHLTATIGETTWNRRNFKTIAQIIDGPSLDYSKDIYWRNNHAAMLPLLMVTPEE